MLETDYLVVGADRDDPAQQAILTRLRQHAHAAVANLALLTTTRRPS